jgi:hypothetical protein
MSNYKSTSAAIEVTLPEGEIAIPPRGVKPICRRDTGIFFVPLIHNGRRVFRTLNTRDRGHAERLAASLEARLREMGIPQPSATSKSRVLEAVRKKPDRFIYKRDPYTVVVGAKFVCTAPDFETACVRRDAFIAQLED